MVKWIKIFDNQYVGFWVLGLLLFLIQEIPYMVMPLFKLETNPIMNMQESSVFLNTCEKVLGSLCIEILQLPFNDRVSDIDDLLLNSLGFIIGYLLYLLAKQVSKKMRRIK